MNKLSKAERVSVIAALVEGASINSTVRMTGISKPTILKLLSEPSASSTKAQLLRNHPRLGYKYEPERSREVRILLYEHYRIAYLVKPGGNIEILGVFHGGLDIDRYFI